MSKKIIAKHSFMNKFPQISFYQLLFFAIVLFANLASNAQSVSWLGANKKVNPYQYQINKSKNYQSAAVSTAHPLASLVGSQIIQKGGNAFDAAIATQLALAVVYPGAGNIGGGGFMLARTKRGNIICLDYRETAPKAASENMYCDKDGKPNTKLSQNGHLAVGVPGTIAGLFETLPYAKLSFKQLIQPAIELAEFGFVITEKEAANLNHTQEAFLKYNTQKTDFVKEQKWKAGDTLIQKDLANTLKRVRDLGAKGFYEGETAQLIVAEMQRGNGLITLEDLKNYKAKHRTPLQFNYKGFDIIGFPPPSSGGVILWQVMKMIEKYPIQEYGFQSTKAVQLMVEAERRAYADRTQHLGDPDFWKVPIRTLTSEQYITDRMKDFSFDITGKSSETQAGNITESEETTHISIYDKEGNMVSITTTLNGSYGCQTVVAGAGFLLNNEMDDFSIKPGVANMYGAIGGKANAIAPNKRMLSSMCPTLVLKNKQPYLVVGSPGGTTIPTSVFQTLVNMLDFNMNAANAVNNPKFHHQYLPDEVFVEKNFSTKTKEQLEKMGYKITPRSSIGRMEVIKINNNKTIEVAADIRGDDCVAGF